MAFENGTSHRGVMSLSWRAADFARAIESLRWKTNRHIATYGVMSHSSHGGQSRCGHTAILTIGATPPDMVTRCAVLAGFVRLLHDHRCSYRELTFQKRDCLGRRISRALLGSKRGPLSGTLAGTATWVLYGFRRPAWKLHRRPPSFAPTLILSSAVKDLLIRSLLP